MIVAVTGAGGLVGRALVGSLERDGHEVRRLVRRVARDAREVQWDPAGPVLDSAALAGAGAVVNLAGEPIAERWTDRHKRDIRESRVRGTMLIAAALAGAGRTDVVLVNASAVGFYGARGDEWVDEASSRGSGFLAEVTEAWEAATRPAEIAGMRVVHARFGLVAARDGGALARLLPPFQLGAGGKLGDGKQWMSWISRTDAVRALRFIIDRAELTGAVNVVAPAPVTNAEFARTLGHVLSRPAAATVPAMMVKLMFGEMATEVLLSGQRVRATRLEAAGFEYRHRTLEEALRFELGQR